MSKLEAFIHGETTLQNKILLDPKLTDTEKYIYLIIKMLSYKSGYVWATNKELAELTNKTVIAINHALRRLRNKNYIVINTNRKRVPMRKIYTFEKWAQLTYLNELPEDVKNTKVIIEANLSFKEFRDIVVKNYKNIEFFLAQNNPLKYKNTTPFIISGSGYLKNVVADKILDPQEALKIWEYLFTRKEKVLEYFRKRKFDAAV